MIGRFGHRTEPRAALCRDERGKACIMSMNRVSAKPFYEGAESVRTGRSAWPWLEAIACGELSSERLV
jgi:hypothetical protein